MSATSSRRRIRWRWIGIALIAAILIALPPIFFVTSTFLRHWSAPYSHWFVDANGQPIAGVCEAAQLPAPGGIRRGTPQEDTISAEDALKIGDRLVMATFDLDAPPEQVAIPVLMTFDFGAYSQTRWVYIAALPSDPASPDLLSEAAPRQKAAIVQIDAVTRTVIDLTAITDAAPPESCHREFRAVVRTTINQLRDRATLIGFATGWGIYVAVLFGLILMLFAVYLNVRSVLKQERQRNP